MNAELREMIETELNPACPLDDVREWFGRYISTMRPADLDLLALWAVHTHVVNETYTTPRLLLDSPVPGSGKTTCLEHLQRLSFKPVLMSAVSSSALLVRMLEAEPRTLLIDEADRSLRPDKPETADVIAILNSGYKVGSTRPTLVPVKGGGWEAREMPTFAPVAMAGNSPNLPDDTRTRTLRVLLMPDLDGAIDESDWELIQPAAEALAARVTNWCNAARGRIKVERPTLPEGVTGRFREKWQPLARVAAVAGGPWPQRVAEMAAADVEQVKRDREDGMITTRPHIVLLHHLAEVWPADDSFAPSSQLVDDLIAHDPRVWGAESTYGKPLTVQRLGRMLATNYGVNTRQVERRRGYVHADMLGAWQRMGVRAPVETVHYVQAVRTVTELDASVHGSHGSHIVHGSTETVTAHGPGCRLHGWADDCPGCYTCDQVHGRTLDGAA